MLYIDQIREYCLSKPETTEHFPFDTVTLVFKVAGKMFALISIDTADSLNLKCEPEYALALREEYEEDIKSGFHMNHKHWNTVSIKGNLTDDFILELIHHSYEQVVKGLKKADRERVNLLLKADKETE